MVDAAEVMLVMLANQANKTIKKEEKEVGRALLLRSIQKGKIQ